MFIRVFLVLVFTAFLGVSRTSAFVGGGETLLMDLPEGYEVVNIENVAGLEITYMFSEDEDLSDYHEVLELFNYPFGGAEMSEYEAFYEKYEHPFCQETTTSFVRKGRENQVEFALLKTSCVIPRAVRGVTVLTKLILGNARTYVVSKTWMYEPDKAEMETWAKYLDGVHVCDTRVDKRGCM